MNHTTRHHNQTHTAPGARRKCFARVERSSRERPSVLHELIVRFELTSFRVLLVQFVSVRSKMSTTPRHHNQTHTAPGARRKCFVCVERSLRERPSVLHELIVRSELNSLAARSERFWCSLCLCGRKCQQRHGTTTKPTRHPEHAASVLRMSKGVCASIPQSYTN